MSYALCPNCNGDGTIAPDRGAIGRPWCRPCLGTGLLLVQPAKLPTAQGEPQERQRTRRQTSRVDGEGDGESGEER